MNNEIFREKKETLDKIKDKKYFILKVLQFWNEDDFKELKKRYGLSEILEIAEKHYTNLDDLTRNFLNIKYGLSLPLVKNINAITSRYSL